jgi:nitroreductase
MDVFEAISGRRSIRKFKKRDVERELILKIVEAGIWAPSAGNIQSWEVVVVRDEKTKEKLAAAAYMRDFIAKAPVVLVLCADKQRSATIYEERGSDLYCIQDTACAAQNMLLAAYALGLGTCWVGAFDEELVRKTLDVPEHIRPVALIPLGYPDEKPYPPLRREIDDLMNCETFKNL